MELDRIKNLNNISYKDQVDSLNKELEEEKEKSKEYLDWYDDINNQLKAALEVIENFKKI